MSRGKKRAALSSSSVFGCVMLLIGCAHSTRKQVDSQPLASDPPLSERETRISRQFLKLMVENDCHGWKVESERVRKDGSLSYMLTNPHDNSAGNHIFLRVKNDGAVYIQAGR